MSKDYQCPACKNTVDRAATVCSNPVCRANLAFCSHCHDITTYTLAAAADGRFSRDRWKCARCERLGVKCLTWLAGGYCNGLARATEPGARGWDKPFCAVCHGRMGEMGRSVIGWTLIGAFGGLLRPRK